MKRRLVVFVFVCAALSLLIGTPALAGKPDKGVKFKAPVPKTGQTESYYTGDDGDLEMGIPWPTPRFTDNGNGTVTDNLTGLVWMKNASNVGADGFGPQDWWSACAACNGLEHGENGLTDGSVAGAWRLPNIREIESLIDYGTYGPALPPGDPFTGVVSSNYWSSTTTADNAAGAKGADFWLGNVIGLHKSFNVSYVWCVRGGP